LAQTLQMRLLEVGCSLFKHCVPSDGTVTIVYTDDLLVLEYIEKDEKF